MSRSEARPLKFDAWLADEFARAGGEVGGGFTALVVLVGIGELSITPLRSTWFHVIGTDTRWPQVAQMLDASGAPWDGVFFETRTDEGGGPLPDPMARIELRELVERLGADRTVLNAGHFFDRRGRRMRVDEVPVQ